MASFVFAGLGLALIQCCSLGDDTITIDLGGLRQAKATLTISENDYVVKVRMLPVRSFDEATNVRLNRDMGRELALWALAKHLSDKDSVEFYVSGARIEKAGADDKFYTLTLRVPQKGVSLVRAGEKPSTKKQGGDRVVFSSALFTRKRDYLDTLDNLSTTVMADVKAIEGKAKGGKEQVDSFSVAVGQIEKAWRNNLTSLGQDIKADLLLFSGDLDELNQAIEKENRRVLTYIQEAVKKQKVEQEKEKSP